MRRRLLSTANLTRVLLAHVCVLLPLTNVEAWSPFVSSTAGRPSAGSSRKAIISNDIPRRYSGKQDHRSPGDVEHERLSWAGPPSSSVARWMAGSVVAGLLLFSNPEASVATSYDALSPEQKFVAEAWRTIDQTFLDRTFNGNDWFQMRQNLVKKKYKSMEEAQSAVSELAASLGDKYTKYLSPAKYQSLVDSATGQLAGVGVEIATDSKGRPIVSDVEPNSPAEQAGLKPNDKFLQGDGQKLDEPGTTPDDVALKLRGPEGTRVGITVERDGNVLDFIVTRKPIKVTSVRSYMVGKVGVIRIKSFSGTTASTVKEEVNNLVSKKGAQKIVFDLRSNPGGLLPGGIETASLFLPANKPVVFVVSNKGVVDAQETFQDGMDLETPITILVDHNTASAAEVFTAALQENGRATVAGEQTFGKGIIQTIRELSNKLGGVAVTVARYETPQHHDINKSGIQVDISTNVDCAKDDALSCLPKTAL